MNAQRRNRYSFCSRRQGSTTEEPHYISVRRLLLENASPHLFQKTRTPKSSPSMDPDASSTNTRTEFSNSKRNTEVCTGSEAIPTRATPAILRHSEATLAQKKLHIFNCKTPTLNPPIFLSHTAFPTLSSQDTQRDGVPDAIPGFIKIHRNISPPTPHASRNTRRRPRHSSNAPQ